MKLLIQGDSFGFSKGITYGILDAIENGRISCTGFLINMPAAELALKIAKEHPEIDYGLDFNIVSGPCVADPKTIPHLVDEEGNFIRTTERRKDPRYQTEERQDMWPLEEVRKELRAQLNLFMDKMGKRPAYFSSHAIGKTSEHYYQAIVELSEETGIPFSLELWNKLGFVNLQGTWNQIPFTLENQQNTDALAYFKAHVSDYDGAEYALLTTHPGFVDAEIFRWSSYNLVRCKDHELLTSAFLREWMDENQIELIRYRDITGKEER